jgi:hypothetical protein
MRMDLLVHRMEERMTFREGERDLLVMVHEVAFADAKGRSGALRSFLSEYGHPGGDTAMARTVGLPAGFATRRILDGTLTQTGVRIPVMPRSTSPCFGTWPAPESRSRSSPPRPDLSPAPAGGPSRTRPSAGLETLKAPLWRMVRSDRSCPKNSSSDPHETAA